MGIIFLFFLLIFLYKTKINFKGLNEGYLNKSNTTTLNGFFILLVFISHFNSYVVYSNKFDILFYNVFIKIGQLMVATFLFFSGYGIYQGIKNKENYIKSFFKRRFLPTYINFFIAVCFFSVLLVFIDNNYTAKNILLSFLGWDSIGNSNWYMFATFNIYILIIIIFRNIKDINKASYTFFFTMILWCLILSKFKDTYWYDTVLCFPIGMIYANFQKNIDKAIDNNKKWFISIIILLSIFIAMYLINNYYSNCYFKFILYNILAIVFVLFISIFMKKCRFESEFFNVLGKNIFWIYILQRIPMILFSSFCKNIYIMFIISFVITYIMAEIMNRCTKKLYKKIKII